MSHSRTLGELLVDRRLLARDELERLLAVEEETGQPFDVLVVDEGLVLEEDLVRVFAERVGLEYVDLEGIIFAPDIVHRLDADTCRLLTAVPIEMVGNELKVAVADPYDQSTIERLEARAGVTIRVAVSSKRSIEKAIDGIFGADLPPGVGSDAERIARARQDEIPRVHPNTLLLELLERAGSDLHLTAGSKPIVRIHGSLVPLDDYDVMTPAELRAMIYSILTEKQRETLENTLELDASHPVPGHARFRMNVFFQRDAVGAVFRAIPEVVVPLEQLGLPKAVDNFSEWPRGLVLVTGPTGSGKSTTLASIIDQINQKRSCHILTIEDPIEFVHQHKKALVNQREVGADTMDFGNALKHALRQDPDVILVGEMRDLVTIQTALTAAETGHLVFATLHTQDAPQSIDRIIDVFPSHQQEQVRVQLAATIQAIVTQQLLPTRDGRGRTVAAEVMVATPAIRNLIREAKIHQITTAMQAGGKHGMQTMDQSLARLVRANAIDYEVAVERCTNIEDLRRLLGRVA
ncbi:MAG: PilT/PilU family type 4a pilus ATPase [Acidimicrobiia bacterium]